MVTLQYSIAHSPARHHHQCDVTDERMAEYQRERFGALLHDRQLAQQSPEIAAVEMQRRRDHLLFYWPQDSTWPDETDEAADLSFHERCAEIIRQGLDINDETLGCPPILLSLSGDLSDADITCLIIAVSVSGYCHHVEAMIARALSRAAVTPAAPTEDAPSQDPLTGLVRETGAPPGAARTVRRHQVSLICRRPSTKEAGHHGRLRTLHGARASTI